jgi:hypothetical protein
LIVSVANSRLRSGERVAATSTRIVRSARKCVVQSIDIASALSSRSSR